MTLDDMLYGHTELRDDLLTALARHNSATRPSVARDVTRKLTSVALVALALPMVWCLHLEGRR